ncbi:MAG: PAS domain S-box protein [Pseudomonadota bacterium]
MNAGKESSGGAGTPAPSGALTALTQAPIGIAIFDRDMRYLAASHRFLTDQAMPADTPLVGRLHYEVFTDIPRRWRDLHARVLAEGIELSHEGERFERDSGVVEWIRWSMAPWRTDDGEIGGLVLYTDVVTAQVEARLQVQAAEARYRAVFDHAPMGVARVGTDGRFLEVNERYSAITGYSCDELLGLTFLDITLPDTLANDVAHADALLAGSIDTYTTEKRYRTKAGGAVWINLTVSLVHTAEGEPDYFVTIAEDITERKQAEVEQQRYQSQLRLLVNELNHRVKNTLATVQSMAAQTMRRAYDREQSYEAFESRLMGLSAAHDVLTRERWHGAILREVAERALRPFCGEGLPRIHLDGPEVWLPPGASLTMALVFHELATNAVKYGSLSADAGHVVIAWTHQPANGALRLSWIERGGPAVSQPSRKGFGSRLIERGLRGELRGRAVVTYAPEGLECVMEARVPRPREIVGWFGDL